MQQQKQPHASIYHARCASVPAGATDDEASSCAVGASQPAIYTRTHVNRSVHIHTALPAWHGMHARGSPAE